MNSWTAPAPLDAEEEEMQNDLLGESLRQGTVGLLRDSKAMVLDYMSLEYLQDKDLPVDKVSLHSAAAGPNDIGAARHDYKVMVQEKFKVPETVYPDAKYWNLMQTKAEPILERLLASS